MRRWALIDDMIELEKRFKQLPRIVGGEAVEFFKDQIDAQEDIKGKPYTQRPYETSRQTGKKILKDRHNLYDAIQILSISPQQIVVGIPTGEVPYAEAHNEGAKIPITEKMRRYFWAMNKKHKGTADADYYKGLALKKTDIIIPQRQFIGDSPQLQKKLEDAIIKALTIR
jgi:phage gpG-like protein